MQQIDLNCDMGELKEGQERNFDAEIMPYISSCNIACGFHSGHPGLIQQTIQEALKHGVQVGAHPSYNDRANFGRKSLRVDLDILKAEVRYQISAIKGMVESLGGHLHHVKPHGALYNDMVKNKELARGVVEVIKEIDPSLKVFVLAGSPVVDICKELGMKAVQEGFADRRYENQTQLRSRQYEDAVIHEPEQILAQIEGFLKHEVTLINQQVTSIQVETLCLHSDTQGAVALSKTIHNYLSEQDVDISAVS